MAGQTFPSIGDYGHRPDDGGCPDDEYGYPSVGLGDSFPPVAHTRPGGNTRIGDLNGGSQALDGPGCEGIDTEHQGWLEPCHEGFHDLTGFHACQAQHPRSDGGDGPESLAGRRWRVAEEVSGD
jgi:hypothetical protein